MSTKIYDAFVWRGRGGLKGLLRKLTAMRAREFEKAVVAAASRNPNAETFSILEYMDDIRGAMKSGVAYTLNGNENPSASATVHFYRGQTYVIFFGINIKRAPFGGLLDFHYQNSSDKPEGISDKDWKNRRRTWDMIFKKNDRPSKAGLVFEIIESSDALRLGDAVFEQLHHHRPGYDEGKCPACLKRRAKAAVDQAAKNLTRPHGAMR